MNALSILSENLFKFCIKIGEKDKRDKDGDGNEDEDKDVVF